MTGSSSRGVARTSRCRVLVSSHEFNSLQSSVNSRFTSSSHSLYAPFFSFALSHNSRSTFTIHVRRTCARCTSTYVAFIHTITLCFCCGSSSADWPLWGHALGLAARHTPCSCMLHSTISSSPRHGEPSSAPWKWCCEGLALGQRRSGCAGAGLEGLEVYKLQVVEAALGQLVVERLHLVEWTVAHANDHDGERHVGGLDNGVDRLALAV